MENVYPCYDDPKKSVGVKKVFLSYKCSVAVTTRFLFT